MKMDVTWKRQARFGRIIDKMRRMSDRNLPWCRTHMDRPENETYPMSVEVYADAPGLDPHWHVDVVRALAGTVYTVGPVEHFTSHHNPRSFLNDREGSRPTDGVRFTLIRK